LTTAPGPKILIVGISASLFFDIMFIFNRCYF
jgi:hypothetical protein